MPTERPGPVLAVVSIAVFMASLDLFIVNIALPDLAREFDGASLADLSRVLNAYAIVFAALLIPAGRIRRPRRAPARVHRRAGALPPRGWRCSRPTRRICCLGCRSAALGLA